MCQTDSTQVDATFSIGDAVRFARSEPIVDDAGTVYRWDYYLEVGTVAEILPDGRAVVEWDDKYWSSASGVFSASELTLL
mgnify:CR=1 FL=1